MAASNAPFLVKIGQKLTEIENKIPISGIEPEGWKKNFKFFEASEVNFDDTSKKICPRPRPRPRAPRGHQYLLVFEEI